MGQEPLDLRIVGEKLLLLLLVSVQLGHKQPRDGLVYAHPQGNEAEFVADFVDGMSTADLCDKWLGGRRGALDLLRSAFDAHGRGEQQA